jgi:hypothetical protein
VNKRDHRDAIPLLAAVTLASLAGGGSPGLRDVLNIPKRRGPRDIQAVLERARSRRNDPAWDPRL